MSARRCCESKQLFAFTLLRLPPSLGREASSTLLFGQVRDPQRGAIPNVRLQLPEPDGAQVVTVINGEGHVTFQLSSGGTCSIEVSAPARPDPHGRVCLERCLEAGRFAAASAFQFFSTHNLSLLSTFGDGLIR